MLNITLFGTLLVTHGPLNCNSLRLFDEFLRRASRKERPARARGLAPLFGGGFVYVQSLANSRHFRCNS